MGVTKKKPSVELALVDRYQIHVCAWPLFGLNRLVKLAHRKRSGILYCDNVMRMSIAITFSKKNTVTSLCTIAHDSPAHVGVYGEPRLNVANEASEADLQRYYDDGTEVVFSFTPKGGKTYSIDSDMHKTFDSGHRYMRYRLDELSRIGKAELTLDVSAYLRSGYSYSGEPPRCDFEKYRKDDNRKNGARPAALNLVGEEKGFGVWQWHVANVVGGMFRLAWELQPRGQSRASKTVNLETLNAELGLNPRLAKDLHNFILTCHYYVAGLRSLRKIAAEMLTDEAVLRRSIEAIEQTLGAELVHRTKGKGVILITPAGEAVLDWWSQFYMKWTPLSRDFTASE
jgi:hypothetical protein